MSSKVKNSRKKTGQNRQNRNVNSALKPKCLEQQIDENNKQIGAVFFFSIGILLFCLSLIEGDNFWKILHEGMFSLFSFAAYIVPLVFMVNGWLLSMKETTSTFQRKMSSSLIWSFLICAALQIFSGVIPNEGNIIENLNKISENGMNMIGGGLFGSVVGVPFLMLFGQTGAGIIITVSIFTGIMITTGMTIADVVRFGKKPIKKINSAYDQAIKQKEKRSIERKFKKAESESQKSEMMNKRLETKSRKSERESVRIPPVQARQNKISDMTSKLSDRQRFKEISRQLSFELDEDEISASKYEVINMAKAEPMDAVMTSRVSREMGNVGVNRRAVSENYRSSVSSNTSRRAFVPPPSKRESKIIEYSFLKNQWEAEERPTLSQVLDVALADEQDKNIIKDVPTPIELIPQQENELKTDSILINPQESGNEGIGKVNCFTESINDLLVEIEDDLSKRNVEKMDLPSNDAVKENNFTAYEPSHTQVRTQIESTVNQSLEIAQRKTETMSENINNNNDDNKDGSYKFPPLSLLNPVPKPVLNPMDVEREQAFRAECLEAALQSFGVKTKVVEITRGPTVTRYELELGAGIKISKIAGLADDIAFSLSASGVRIAPVPEKSVVGIEVPNKSVDTVLLTSIINSEEFRESDSKLTVCLGKKIAGTIATTDIAKAPHMLIAGATGTGKSVCLNSMIMSILFKATPDEVRLIMVDPKKVEFGVYNGIPHLMVPVVTDCKKAAGALNWAVNEMENRYLIFQENGVRNIDGYNKLAKIRDDIDPLPSIVIVIDELADLMLVAKNEVEEAINRLAAKARAAGMHLVLATQRPSVDVITGVIKSNIPSRIAVRASSQIDSRTILNESGAEKLLGRGDMLFAPVGVAKPSRIQGCFVSDNEIENVVNFVKMQRAASYDDKVAKEIEILSMDKNDDTEDILNTDETDVLWIDAITCVVEHEQGSTSLLQRKLSIGYSRASRLIDKMQECGILGPPNGSKPREVLLSREGLLEMKARA